MWGKEKPGEPELQRPSAPVVSGRAASAVGQAIETTIGPNTYIKGNIQGDAGLRIEGVIDGNVETIGNLVITESAKVFAEVKANNVSIAGAVKGNIHANRVEILATGRVWGDLTMKELLINDGGYHSGQNFMPSDIQPPQLDAAKMTRETPRPAAPPPMAPAKEPEKK